MMKRSRMRIKTLERKGEGGRKGGETVDKNQKDEGVRGGYGRKRRRRMRREKKNYEQSKTKGENILWHYWEVVVM